MRESQQKHHSGKALIEFYMQKKRNEGKKRNFAISELMLICKKKRISKINKQ
jgi:hypothetical protein